LALQQLLVNLQRSTAYIAEVKICSVLGPAERWSISVPCTTAVDERLTNRRRCWLAAAAAADAAEAGFLITVSTLLNQLSRSRKVRLNWLKIRH